MSFGLLMSQDWDALPMEELLQHADAALYAAKAAGRNCVKVARPKASSSGVRSPVHLPVRL
jgi:PleD family two-component response regulator